MMPLTVRALLLAGIAMVAGCSHVLPDLSTSNVDPHQAATELEQELLLLTEGARTLTARVEGVEVETRIALSSAEAEAAWSRATEAFDALQPHLALSAHEQLALEYDFALLHDAARRGDGAPAQALYDRLTPQLRRLRPGELASR